MKTSNYSKFSKLPQEEKLKYFPIVISNTIPNWFTDDYETLGYLSPPSSIWLASSCATYGKIIIYLKV